MIRKHSVYQLAILAWGLVTAAAVILVVSGNARPHVSPDVIPYGGPGAFGLIAVVWLGGAFVVGRLEASSWKQMGRRVGLAPVGRSLFGKPDLAGTVDGRAVRAYTYSVKKGGGDEGSSSVTYTVVEAELRAPESNGYVLAHGDAELVDDDVPEEIQRKDLGGAFFLIGDVSADDGRRLLTGRVQDALGGSSGPGAVVVGDPTDAVMSAFPDDVGLLGSMVESGLRSKLEDRRSFAAGTAAHDGRGLILDPATLEARIAAVVATADAHEATSVEAPGA